jgi:hypothetical protein
MTRWKPTTWGRGLALLLCSCGNGVTETPVCKTPDAVSISFAPFPAVAVVMTDLPVSGAVTVGTDTIIESIVLGVRGPFADAVPSIPAIVGSNNQTWSATVPILDLLGPSQGAPAQVALTVTANTNCGMAPKNASATSEPFLVAPPPDGGASVDAAPESDAADAGSQDGP